jgi:hypothetical protein
MAKIIPSVPANVYVSYGLWRIVLSLASRHVALYCDGRHAGDAIYRGDGRWSSVTFRSHYTRLSRKELQHAGMLLDEADLSIRPGRSPATVG